jgi:hypothetical protein
MTNGRSPQNGMVSQYLLATVSIVFIVIVAIVAIVLLRPGQDNSGIITTIVGFSAPTLLALVAFLKGNQNSEALQANTDMTVQAANKADVAAQHSEVAAQKAIKSAAVVDSLKADVASVKLDVEVVKKQSDGMIETIQKSAFVAGVQSEKDKNGS